MSYEQESLTSLLSQPENEKLEFKLNIPQWDEMAKLISAMANTNGGKIVIGVDDNGKVIGISPERLHEVSKVYEAAMVSLNPSPHSTFQEIQVDRKAVALISVERSKTQVWSNNRLFTRRGATNQLTASRLPRSRRMLRLASSFSVIAGAIIILFSALKLEHFWGVLKQHTPETTGVVLMFLGILISRLLTANHQKPVSERKFIDVDRHSKEVQRFRNQISLLVNKISQLEKEKERANFVKAQNSDSSGERKISSDATHPFCMHFNALTSALSDKAANADQKASMLLDKGVIYARFGIGFYLVSVLMWQGLAWWRGFQIQFIYGIASCSLLFVFIEFFSAWFLKQYRQFVDTSTYLTKVKSIFDRYVLMFYLASDTEIHAEKNKLTVSALTDVLKNEISWPDSYLLKTQDVGFAKDAISSLTEVGKALVELKNSQSKSEK